MGAKLKCTQVKPELIQPNSAVSILSLLLIHNVFIFPTFLWLYTKISRLDFFRKSFEWDCVYPIILKPKDLIMKSMHSHPLSKFFTENIAKHYENIFNRLKRRRIDKMGEFDMPRFCNNLHGDPNLLFHLQMPNNMFEYMSWKKAIFRPPSVAL